MSIKRFKESKLIKNVYKICLYRLNLTKFDKIKYIFDLFRPIFNFLIKSGSKLINFVATMQILITNSIENVNLNLFQSQLKWKFQPKSIQWPKLTRK